MNIAPENGNWPWERTLCPLCPSCAQVPKTCSHMLFCSNEGWVNALMKSINLLSSWMVEVDTDPDLRECIAGYAKGRGTITMSEFFWDIDARFWKMACDQDEISWQSFMEGMVCVCVFLASGYGWVTVMHAIPISSAQLLTSLPYTLGLSSTTPLDPPGGLLEKVPTSP
jgi:hypothetical protein